ncbi:hypothetical protein JCM10212_005870 [Sporobolomyces blumeae]
MSGRTRTRREERDLDAAAHAHAAAAAAAARAGAESTRDNDDLDERGDIVIRDGRDLDRPGEEQDLDEDEVDDDDEDEEDDEEDEDEDEEGSGSGTRTNRRAKGKGSTGKSSKNQVKKKKMATTTKQGVAQPERVKNLNKRNSGSVGRRKIDMQYIEEKARRTVTFTKRKSGLMKKAFELSTLTGTDCLVVVVSESGLVYTFATPTLKGVTEHRRGKEVISAALRGELGVGGEEGCESGGEASDDQDDEGMGDGGRDEQEEQERREGRGDARKGKRRRSDDRAGEGGGGQLKRGRTGSTRARGTTRSKSLSATPGGRDAVPDDALATEFDYAHLLNASNLAPDHASPLASSHSTSYFLPSVFSFDPAQTPDPHHPELDLPIPPVSFDSTMFLPPSASSSSTATTTDHVLPHAQTQAPSSTQEPYHHFFLPPPPDAGPNPSDSNDSERTAPTGSAPVPHSSLAPPPLPVHAISSFLHPPPFSAVSLPDIPRSPGTFSVPVTLAQHVGVDAVPDPARTTPSSSIVSSSTTTVGPRLSLGPGEGDETPYARAARTHLAAFREFQAASRFNRVPSYVVGQSQSTRADGGPEQSTSEETERMMEARDAREGRGERGDGLDRRGDLAFEEEKEEREGERQKPKHGAHEFGDEARKWAKRITDSAGRGGDGRGAIDVEASTRDARVQVDGTEQGSERTSREASATIAAGRLAVDGRSSRDSSAVLDDRIGRAISRSDSFGEDRRVSASTEGTQCRSWTERAKDAIEDARRSCTIASFLYAHSLSLLATSRVPSSRFASVESNPSPSSASVIAPSAIAALYALLRTPAADVLGQFAEMAVSAQIDDSTELEGAVDLFLAERLPSLPTFARSTKPLSHLLATSKHHLVSLFDFLDGHRLVPHHVVTELVRFREGARERLSDEARTKARCEVGTRSSNGSQQPE